MPDPRIVGFYIGLTADELAAERTKWLACIQKIRVLGQSVTLDGKSYGQANIAEALNALREVNYAIRQLDPARKFERLTYISQGQ